MDEENSTDAAHVNSNGKSIRKDPSRNWEDSITNR